MRTELKADTELGAGADVKNVPGADASSCADADSYDQCPGADAGEGNAADKSTKVMPNLLKNNCSEWSEYVRSILGSMSACILLTPLQACLMLCACRSGKC